MNTRVANLGYVAIRKETTKGTPAGVPNVYLPAYKESMMTEVNLNESSPLIGNKAARHKLIQGMRHHTGSIQTLAEPNSAGYLFDMLLYKSNTSGSNPYTHTFTLGETNPNAYTMDISKGNVVFRFMGVEASQIAASFEDNRMLFDTELSGLKSFMVREIASVATSTVTLKTNYDPNPTHGLVVGDLIRLQKSSDNSTTDFTVVSVDSDTVVTLSASTSGFADGDMFYIRPNTPSFSLATECLWARSEFRFADTISNALTASNITPDEASWTIMHSMNSNEGEKRSGSFDPAVLARTLGDAELNVKKFFDSPFDLNRFLAVAERSIACRHFSGTNHEIQVALASAKSDTMPTGLETGSPILSDMNFKTEYDDVEGKIFEVKIINSVATI